eukprot:g2509.t1
MRSRVRALLFRRLASSSAESFLDGLNARSTRFIAEQNEKTARWMRDVQSARRTLLEEMYDGVPDTETTASEAADDGVYEYFAHADGDDELLKYCRRSVDGNSSDVEVILDPNEIMRENEGEGVALGHLAVSDDHKYLAYCADLSGGEDWTLFVKCIDSGITRVRGRGVVRVEWAGTADPGMLYYSKRDPSDGRPTKICRRNVLRAQSNEEVLLDATEDRTLFADIKRTKDGEYLLAYFNAKTRTTLHALSLREPSPDPSRLWPPIDSNDDDDNCATSMCFAEHNNGFWYLLTRTSDADFSMRRVACGAPLDAAETLFPSRPGRAVEDMDMFETHCVLYAREEGLPTVRCFAIDDPNVVSKVPLPNIRDDEPRVVVPAPNASFASSVARFECASPTRAPIACAYDLRTGSTTTCTTSTTREPFSLDELVCYREVVRSDDGTEVPLTLIRRRDARRDGANPVLLTGYGAYGVPLEATFSPARLSLLRRGWVVALAHVRGGGDLGASWHRDGRTFRKRNSFADFIACAEWLAEVGWTSPRLLTARAASAGALLLGAAANERPDLFAAMVLDMPFLDVEGEMTSAPYRTAALAEHEEDEWGNCRDDPAALAYVRAWSPLSNVRTQSYPAMLVTTSLHDGRVSWSHAAKWVRLVQKHTTGSAPVLLKTTDAGTGHFGSGGRFQRHEETAFAYGFLGRCVGAW